MKLSKSIAAGILIASVLLGTSGCAANDTLAQQFKNGDNKNYIAGDGTVTEFAPDNRGQAVSWAGLSESGALLSSDQLSGVAVVLNFWYAGCAPCRAEAPDLVALQAEFKDQNVQFIGVNVRDTAATALAFDRNFKLTYPSVMDNNTGSVLLAFTGVVTPQAVPTTLVIDRAGRVSARILGRIERATLKALIKTAAAETLK